MKLLTIKVLKATYTMTRIRVGHLNSTRCE